MGIISHKSARESVCLIATASYHVDDAIQYILEETDAAR